MERILMVTPRRVRFSKLAEALENTEKRRIDWATDGTEALAAVRSVAPKLAIVDESLPDMTGIEWIRRLISVNAFVNTALVSGRSPEDFHEATEGLGVAVQLSDPPAKEQTTALLSLLH